LQVLLLGKLVSQLVPDKVTAVLAREPKLSPKVEQSQTARHRIRAA
jgi:hypothetical protein